METHYSFIDENNIKTWNCPNTKELGKNKTDLNKKTLTIFLSYYLTHRAVPKDKHNICSYTFYPELILRIINIHK